MKGDQWLNSLHHLQAKNSWPDDAYQPRRRVGAFDFFAGLAFFPLDNDLARDTVLAGLVFTFLSFVFGVLVVLALVVRVLDLDKVFAFGMADFFCPTLDVLDLPTIFDVEDRLDFKETLPCRTELAFVTRAALALAGERVGADVVC